MGTAPPRVYMTTSCIGIDSGSSSSIRAAPVIRTYNKPRRGRAGDALCRILGYLFIYYVNRTRKIMQKSTKKRKKTYKTKKNTSHQKRVPTLQCYL